MTTKKYGLRWIALLSVGILLIAYNYSRGGQRPQYPTPTRDLQLTGNQTKFEIPAMPMNAWTRSHSGDLIFLSRASEGAWKIVRRSVAGSMNEFSIPSIAELKDGVGQPMQDIAFDSSGSIYLPIIWRYTKQNEGVGVVVLDNNGNFNRLIRLHQRSEIRHVTVGNDGSLYVLGIDPAYFNRLTNSCYLLHKYTTQGDRIASFSPCPDVTNLRQPGSIVPGKGFDQLMQETQRGSVWLKGESAFHLLPYAHELREFSSDGKAKGKIVLDVPPPGQPSDIAAQVFPRTDGTLLTIWLHMEMTGLNAFNSAKYMSLHGGDGRALSVGTPVRADDGVPFLADENGQVFALARGQRGYRINHADVALR